MTPTQSASFCSLDDSCWRCFLLRLVQPFIPIRSFRHAVGRRQDVRWQVNGEALSSVSTTLRSCRLANCSSNDLDEPFQNPTQLLLNRKAHPKRHLICAMVSSLLFFVTGEWREDDSFFERHILDLDRKRGDLLCSQVVTMRTIRSLRTSVDPFASFSLVVNGNLCHRSVHLFDAWLVSIHSTHRKSLIKRVFYTLVGQQMSVNSKEFCSRFKNWDVLVN